MRTTIRDRLALVACAFVVGAALLGGMAFADLGLGLAREQLFFVGGAFVYNVTALYFLQQLVLRRMHRLVRKAVAVVLVESPVALFLLLFSCRAIPWPTSMFSYMAATIVITPITITLANSLLLRGTGR